MKKIMILSGIPGSGKSTFTREFCLNNEAVVVSADHFFEKDGEYRFDRRFLGDAHGECLRRFVESVKANQPIILVDNTNLTLIDIAPYYAVGRAFGYDVTIKTFLVDEETSFKRNVHSVPMKSIRDMSDRLSRRKFPPYWTISEER
jgi:predicted kinase